MSEQFVGVAGHAQHGQMRRGRQFGSGLVLHENRMPSATCAEGIFVGGGRNLPGAAGVPFGAAKVEESEVGFFLAERAGVGSQGQFGVCMGEL